MAKQLMSKKQHLSTWAGSLQRNNGALSADTLASMFTPSQPMYAVGLNPELIKIKGDVPPALLKEIAKGLTKIGLDCLRQNADMYLKIYEDICLRHVLDKQIQGKDLKKLLAVQDPKQGGAKSGPGEKGGQHRVLVQ